MNNAFPRTCGGDPVPDYQFSSSLVLFPACAGVILKSERRINHEKTFPRMRGGDPSVSVNGVSGVRFSPHARG